MSDDLKNIDSVNEVADVVDNDAENLKVFLTIYTISILLGVINPFYTAGALALYTLATSIFVIAKSFKVIMLIIGLSIIAAVFPPLGFMLLAALVYFFIRRFDFFVKNYESVFLGLFIYTLPILISVGVGADRHSGSYGFIMFPVMAIFFRYFAKYFMMRISKKKGASIKHIIFVMGLAPLLVTSLFLPFMKFDIAFGEAVAGGASSSGESLGAEGLLAGKVNNVNPELHHVNGYVRTIADGIPENNLSYHGEGKIHDVKGFEVVNSHVRTHADGIVENNISYAGNKTGATGALDGVADGVVSSAKDVSPKNAIQNSVTGLAISSDGKGSAGSGSDNVRKKTMNKWVAVLILLLVPGLGQLYVNSFTLGFSLFFTQLAILTLALESKGAVLFFLSFIGIIIPIFSLVHTVNKVNAVDDGGQDFAETENGEKIYECGGCSREFISPFDNNIRRCPDCGTSSSLFVRKKGRLDI